MSDLARTNQARESALPSAGVSRQRTGLIAMTMRIQQYSSRHSSVDTSNHGRIRGRHLLKPHRPPVDGLYRCSYTLVQCHTARSVSVEDRYEYVYDLMQDVSTTAAVYVCVYSINALTPHSPKLLLFWCKVALDEEDECCCE